MRDTIARRLRPRHGPGSGRSPLSPEERAVNLSLVLHEPSDSRPVQSAVEAVRQPLPRMKPNATLIRDGDVSLNVDAWLVPSLGYPDELPAVSGEVTPRIVVDAGDGPLKQVVFFRAPARLSLPGPEVSCVGVLALIRRPGGRSKQVISRGPFQWPADEAIALRVLEMLIQAHAEQWRPRAQLWSQPAEVLLASDFSH